MLRYKTIFIKGIIAIILLISCPAFTAPDQRETPVVKAVREVSPAVVNINSQYKVRTNPFSGFGIDPFFDKFFNDFRGPRFQERTSLGSGVIIDGKRGFILTNAHVLAKSDDITVTLKDKREFKARVIGADPDSDLAVLQVSSDSGTPSIQMGRSDNLMIGETVIAIGNPFGFSHTVTTGVISAINRTVRADKRLYENFIQIDASINPGNSGGPLLNINGELIGINTAIYSKAQGIGFAIPIDNAKKIVADLIQFGLVVPAWIGLFVQDIDKDLAGYMNLESGIIVKEVQKSSPSNKAGILSRDIILYISGKKVDSSKDYRDALKNLADGDILNMVVWRQGKEIPFSITASIFPKEMAPDIGYKLLGIRVIELKGEGVVISDIKDDSFLSRIGAISGDIIRQIDDMTIDSTEDFYNAIIKYRLKKSVVILIQRGEKGYYITAQM